MQYCRILTPALRACSRIIEEAQMRPTRALPVALAIALTSIAITVGGNQPEAPKEQLQFLNIQLPATYSAALAPTSTPDRCEPPDCFSDCGWRGEAFAFVDENGDGKCGTHEPPLADVSFHLNDPYNQYEDFKRDGMSNASGKGEVLVLLIPCGTTFGVYAVPPTGYTHTTPQLLSGNVPLIFGFRPISALPGLPATGHP